MKGRKQKNHDSASKDQTLKKPPDHQIKPINDSKTEELPEIYKIVKRGDSDLQNRRDFIKILVGTLSLSALTIAISGCVDYSIETDDEKCTCHVVCACDTESSCGSCGGCYWYPC